MRHEVYAEVTGMSRKLQRGSRGVCGGRKSGDFIELMFAGDPLVTVSDVPDPVRESHPLVRHQANNLACPSFAVSSTVVRRAVLAPAPMSVTEHEGGRTRYPMAVAVLPQVSLAK